MCYKQFSKRLVLAQIVCELAYNNLHLFREADWPMTLRVACNSLARSVHSFASPAILGSFLVLFADLVSFASVYKDNSLYIVSLIKRLHPSFQ